MGTSSLWRVLMLVVVALWCQVPLWCKAQAQGDPSANLQHQNDGLRPNEGNVALPNNTDTPKNVRSTTKNGPLFAIVTGLEHSGTTVLSSLIKNAPGVFGGFECGFLLAESPAAFNAQCCKPWDAWIMAQGQHMWNVSAEGLQSIRRARNFDDMYARLILASPTLAAIPNVRVLDKTPAYIRELSHVLDKAPGVPCVVIVKDKVVHNGLLLAQEHHAKRILVVDHHLLMVDTHATMQRVFKFLGLHWDPDYLSMRGFIQQLALSHGKCPAEKIASEFAFSPGAHTPGSKGHQTQRKWLSPDCRASHEQQP